MFGLPFILLLLVFLSPDLPCPSILSLFASDINTLFVVGLGAPLSSVEGPLIVNTLDPRSGLNCIIQRRLGSVWYRNPFMNLMTQLCKGGTSRAFWRTQGIMGIIREIPISPGNDQTIRKSKRSRWSLWLSDKCRTLSLQYRKTDMRLFTSHGLAGCVENSSRDGWEGTFWLVGALEPLEPRRTEP